MIRKISSKFYNILLFLFYPIFFFVILWKPFAIESNSLILLVDTFIPYLPSKANFDTFVSYWSQSNFGMPSSGSLILPFISVMSKFFDIFLLQRIIVFSIPVISSIAMHVFLEKTGLCKSKFLIITGAVIYGASGLIATNFSATGIMLIYAISPLVMFFTFKLLFSENKISLNIIGLAFSLTIATSFNYQAIALLSPIILFLILAKILKEKTFSWISYKFLIFIFAFVLYLLLSLPIFSILFDNIISEGVSFKAAIENLGISINPIIKGVYEIRYPISLSIFSTLFQGFSEIPANFIFFYSVGCLFLITIVFSIFSTNKLKRVISISFFFLLIFINGWTLLIKAGSPIPNIIFSKFLFLMPFASSGKLMIIISPFLCVLFIFGLEELKKRIERLTNKNTSIFFILIIIFLVFSFIFSYKNFAVFNLDRKIISLPAISGQGGKHEVNYGTIPQYSIDLNMDFHKERIENGPFRVLFSPQEGANMYLGSLYMESSVYPSGINVLDRYTEKQIKRISNFWGEEKDLSELNIGLAFKPLNIKYFVVLKTFEQKGAPRIWYSGKIPEYIVGDPKIFETILDAQKDIKRVKETEEYILYENEEFLPRIFISHDCLEMINISSLNWEEISPNRNFQVHITKMDPLYSPSKYEVYVKPLTDEADKKQESYLYLNERFYKNWKAYIVSDEGKIELAHFKAENWANGYQIIRQENNAQEFKIEIVNEKQKIRNFVLIIWVISLSVSVMYGLYFIMIRKHHNL